MPSDSYDVIIVGAGIEGAYTAYCCRQKGLKCLLIDQFSIPNNENSSKGLSRITRKVYPEGKHYTKMMFEAFKFWDDLQNKAQEQLFVKCNTMLITFYKEKLEPLQKEFDHFSLPYEYLSSDQLAVKFPNNNFEGMTALLDLTGGMLLADRCLKAVVDQYLKTGGEIAEYERVNQIQFKNPSKIVVNTNKRCITSSRIVITVGPWARPVLQLLGLTLKLKADPVLAIYWKMLKKDAYSYRNFPCFMHNDREFDVYALPSYEFPDMMKLCLMNKPGDFYGQLDETFHPDRPLYKTNPNSCDWSLLSRYIRTHFPFLEDTPSRIEQCFFTRTPHSNPYLDYHPDCRRIILGVGFSGHGFKLAPVVGDILSDLVLERKPKYEMQHFRVDRFDAKQSKL